jgi:PEP-CTERM motif
MIVRLILGGTAAAAAPETSTWALMLAGFAGLGLAGLSQGKEQTDVGLRLIVVRRGGQSAATPSRLAAVAHTGVRMMILRRRSSDMIAKLMFAGAAAVLATAGGASAQTYDYTTIGVPGSIDTASLGINDSGAVTGDYDIGSTQHAFIYSGGTYTKLRAGTVGTAINDLGEVIGGEGDFGFLYSDATFTQIKFPGSSLTEATGINGSGAIAGYYTKGPKNLNSGFVDSAGTYTRIKFPDSINTFVMGIDSSGDVAGYYDKGPKDEDFGFIESGGTYTTIEPTGAKATLVEGMSASGAAWGSYKKSTKGKDIAFVYSGGTYATIDVPSSTSTYVTGINASGVIAGDYTSGSTEFGFVDSGGTYTTIDVAGSTDTYVEGINNSGQVTGYSLSGSGTFGFIATPQTDAIMMAPSAAAAPEPSTWALMLAGLAGLGLAGYRKARGGRTALFLTVLRRGPQSVATVLVCGKPEPAHIADYERENLGHDPQIDLCRRCRGPGHRGRRFGRDV